MEESVIIKETVQIPESIQRHLLDKLDEAVAEYEGLMKRKTGKVHLCWNRKERHFWVSEYFTREFLEFRNVIVIL